MLASSLHLTSLQSPEMLTNMFSQLLLAAGWFSRRPRSDEVCAEVVVLACVSAAEQFAGRRSWGCAGSCGPLGCSGISTHLLMLSSKLLIFAKVAKISASRGACAQKSDSTTAVSSAHALTQVPGSETAIFLIVHLPPAHTGKVTEGIPDAPRPASETQGTSDLCS